MWTGNTSADACFCFRLKKLFVEKKEGSVEQNEEQNNEQDNDNDNEGGEE
jgi:hypothetical protein